MSNIPISQLDTTATSLGNNDLFLISSYNNDTFTSAKINYENVKNTIINDVKNTIINDINNSSTTTITNIIQTIYPIGSIYISTNDTNPSEIFGVGTWIKVSSGKCLWGSDDDHTAGSTIDEGLPAVSGTATGLSCSSSGAHSHKLSSNVWGVGSIGPNCQSGTSCSMVSSVPTTTSSGAHTHSITGTVNITGTGVYGKTTNVQPAAFVVNIWQRTE